MTERVDDRDVSPTDSSKGGGRVSSATVVVFAAIAIFLLWDLYGALSSPNDDPAVNVPTHAQLSQTSTSGSDT